MPKILVADDNTNIQKMVSLAFEERGIDVVSVGNGEAAVRRIPDMNPDLVLADIFMPVRNGYEVCEFVKKDGRFSHVPVILLVGAFDPLDEKEARRVGADGVLKKPFVPPDPLIAMVISALEKNPKVAAEMAKAKEVVPPPEPEPMPAALEMPARAEVKPLPEFPEPSAEEAALVYGFGSGKRGNEDLAEGKAPRPADVDSKEEEEEDSEQDISTHDWRRSAMNLEIPEETSKTTAFALDDEPATAMFPSEKEVPPKHVDVKKASKNFEAESVTKTTPEVSAAVPAAEPMTPAPLPASVRTHQMSEPVEAPDSFLTATMLVTDSVVPVTAVTAETVSSGAPVDAPPVKSARESSANERETVETKSAALPPPAAAEKINETPVLEIEQAPEPTFAARATHWMDAMSAALKAPEPEEQSWADPAPPVKMDLDAKEASPAPTTPMETPEIAPAPAPEIEAHPIAASTPAPPALSEELAISTEPVEPEKEEGFFADDESAAPQWIPVVAAETKKLSAVAPNDPALETSAPVPVSHLSADPELIAEPEDASPVAKDPALVEPPSVHVTPEPLLVDETSSPTAASTYDKREEPIPPAFAFTEAPQEPEVPVEAAQRTDPEPAKDGRVPTMPPPNREVLAEIPFLSPPKEFLEATAEQNKAEDAQVDDVVRKVLEKLEPQLHDLLSQGLLKPLVENIIQNDLAKKGR